MHTVKQKVSNAASVAKEHAEIYKAQVQEKAEKATARTSEEREIAHERRKAKEAEAKMVMHAEKAEHASEKLHGKHFHHHHHQAPVVGSANNQAPVIGGQGHHHPLAHHEPHVGAVDPLSGAAVAPTYPLGGQLPAGQHNKYV